MEDYIDIIIGKGPSARGTLTAKGCVGRCHYEPGAGGTVAGPLWYCQEVGINNRNYY